MNVPIPEEWMDTNEFVRHIREELHQIPELGLNLPMTRAYICKELDKLNIPYKLNEKDSGLVATICGNKEGKVLAFRSDMDALPMGEETGLPFSSQHPGIMHSCGHDAHAAMLLGTARILKAHEAEIPGTVKLIFQSAEETAKGAKAMIEAGALHDPEVDAIYGLHIASIPNANLPTGTLLVTPGCAMVSYDRFILDIKGLGCHGAIPEKGIDPIVIGSNIVLALQEIIARETGATIPAVVTIGSFVGGDTFNIIPDSAHIEGTIRAVEEADRQRIVKRIEEISTSIAAAYRGTCTMTMDWGAPPVVNDEKMVEIAREAGKEVLGEENVATKAALNMGGEDFAYYLLEKPGAYMFVVTNSEYPQHNPHYEFERGLLWRGPAIFSTITKKYFGIDW